MTEPPRTRAASVALWQKIADFWAMGYDTQRIAQRLDISEAAVHNALPRALKASEPAP